MISNIADTLKPLEDVIRLKLIPAITGRLGISNLERDLFSLPARLGGLNIPNPQIRAPSEYDASVKVTSALVEAVRQKSGKLDYSMVRKTQSLK